MSRSRHLILALIGFNLILILVILTGATVTWSASKNAPTLQAQSAPSLISYHGQISDAGGPVNGARDFTFLVFGQESGGNPLWVETHGGVPLVEGEFTVLLGATGVPSGTLPTTLFDAPERWLEIVVDGTVLTPRQRFTSAPYALSAEKVGGKSAAELGLPAGALVWLPQGQNPPGFTRRADLLGQDIAPWRPIPNMPPEITDPACRIWTGAELICLNNSGYDQTTLTGARYNPATDSWTMLPSAGAPSPRRNYSAVWTGSALIVWGGERPTYQMYNDGAAWQASSNSWTALPTNNAPSARYGHTAVWSGSEMILWGGSGEFTYFDDGALYNGAGWQSISATDAPSARINSLSLWTGSEMIVYGGRDSNSVWQDNGKRYNPSSNTWVEMSAPPPVSRNEMPSHGMVWTGTEAAFDLRGSLYFYNPASNAWRLAPRPSYGIPASSAPALSADGHWLVTGMGIFDLLQDEWVAYPPSRPSIYPVDLFWAGDEVILCWWEECFRHTPEIVYPFTKD
jgi:hypothetical protein